MKKLLLILSMPALTALNFVNAQEGPKFTVEVSSDSVLMDNYFTVTFTLENAEGLNFAPPAFDGFELVSGPNTSTSMSMINGEVTRKVAYTYYLRPLNIGNYYIEPASIESDEGVLETLPREVIVLPNPEGIIQQPRSKTETFRFDMGAPDWDSFFGPGFKMDELQDMQKLFPNMEEWHNQMKGFFPNWDELRQMEPDTTQKKKKRKVFKM